MPPRRRPWSTRVSRTARSPWSTARTGRCRRTASAAWSWTCPPSRCPRWSTGRSPKLASVRPACTTTAAHADPILVSPRPPWSATAEVVALITDLRRERDTSLVFITHDIELVGALCDRILVMYMGRIVEELTPAQLHGGKISHPYTEALLACRPDITRRRHRLPAVPAGAFEEGWAGQ